MTGATTTMMLPGTVLALLRKRGLPMWLGVLSAVAVAEQAIETVTIFGFTGFTRIKIAALVVLASAVVAAGSLPQFEDYRVAVETIAKPKLDLRSHPQARTYRTRLREALDDGKKFAGHYLVASWGCGSSCEQFAFIDAASGKVYLPGMVSYPVWDEGCPELYGLDFRPDSALLKIYGSPNDKEEAGTYYFVWADGKLKEVAHVPGCPKQ